MSQHMEMMALGDTIDVKGPLGHFIYDGCGAFRNSGRKGFAKKMSMIAGGTGITPMFQIIKVSPVTVASPSRHEGIQAERCARQLTSICQGAYSQPQPSAP